MDKINKISVNGVEYLIEDLELTEIVESLKTTKQDALNSGVNIKTINGETILGEGDIEISFEAELDDKQDVIEDLEEIRSNASLGATALQSIPDEYATKSFVEDQVAELVGSAPDKLNTLEELAKALKEDESIVDTLNNAINEKQDNLISGTSIKTVNGESLLGEGDIVIESGVQECVVKITYSDLKALRDNAQLVPGCQYCITDYITTTTTENTKSANHQFDIIVTADSSNTLSHHARAILHEEDTYFENCNLSAWKLWYDLDNNTDKYEWADAENGKGVIYRMIDEHNNDCPYDFKNIMFYTDKFETIILNSYYPEDNYYYTFSVYKETEERIVDQTTMARYYPTNNCMGAVISGLRYQLNKNIIYNDEDPGVYPHENKFSNICIDNIIRGEFACNTLDGSSHNMFGSACKNNIIYWCNNNIFGGHCCNNTFGEYCHNNTFGEYCCNNTFGGHCHNNTFGEYCENNNFGYGCCNNTFGDECKFNTFKGFTEYRIDNGEEWIYSSNTLGDNCCNNTFGIDCYNNVLGNSCRGNIFGNDCCDNIFKDDCHDNIFGASCSSIVFSDIECSNNTFGNSCSDITFGECCEKNNFGPSCYNNTFGKSCYNNTFGSNCSGNSFGSNCNNIIFENNCIRIDFGNYFSNIKLENVCKFIHLNSSTETTFKNELQNIKISSSICGTQAEPLELTIEPNRDFETKVAKNSNGEIKIYCEADLIN